jgi:hypothetical protein
MRRGRDRVGQRVTNGVRISPKWVQRSLLHAVNEPVGLRFQPGLVDAPGAADDGVEQPRVQASILVTGQIDHDRHRSIRSHFGRPQMCSSTPRVFTRASRSV